MQFWGCAGAFVDSLSGELNAAAMYMRKLEGQSKGAAFAFEMSLDRHRYGAMMVLDRWAGLVGAFGPHLQLARFPAVIEQAPSRVEAAGAILERANRVIDAAEAYAPEVVEACTVAMQSIEGTFQEEREAASELARLGPMLPQEYTEARRIFMQDLAAR